MLSQSRGTLASRYVYLRVPSSVQQPSATLSKYVFYSTCSFCLSHFVPYPMSDFFVVFFSSSRIFFFSFFVALISRAAYFLLSGTLVDLPTSII